MHLTNTSYTVAKDGSKLAFTYTRCGRAGAPTVVMSNGYATTHFYWRHVFEQLRPHADLITWDYRGHGQSGPSQTLKGLSMRDLCDDLWRILDTVKVERALLFGFSFGCQVTLESFQDYAARIDAVVVALGTYERPFDNLFHPKVGPQLYKLFERAAPRLGPAGMRAASYGQRGGVGYWGGRLLGMIEGSIPESEMAPFFEHFALIDGATWAAIGAAAQAHSAERLLPKIHVPTLIIAGGKDTWTPSPKSQHLHEAIAGSDYVFLPHATHTGLLGHAPQVVGAIDAFLHQHNLI